VSQENETLVICIFNGADKIYSTFAAQHQNTSESYAHVQFDRHLADILLVYAEQTVNKVEVRSHWQRREVDRLVTAA